MVGPAVKKPIKCAHTEVPTLQCLPEPGAPSGTPFAKCPIYVKCQEMWLFKIPGNKISTQQLSNGHISHSVKQKPSAELSGLGPLLSGSPGLSCDVQKDIRRGRRIARLPRLVSTPGADRGQCCTLQKSSARLDRTGEIPFSTQTTSSLIRSRSN